ncbi:hypothetical protein PVAND_016068 [Polypedilum vanderplanki]|uniref:Uncharacterized protein n=1 Tax=Polypedilum vanderplanki TaxID=319348 RepID=A0A9J6BF44_POLVA|nr:hypothetical protein PVAND_016068 [Polypedilum vanderplanki]
MSSVSNAGGDSSCELYQEIFNETLKSFTKDVQSAVNSTIENMENFADENPNLSQNEFNIGLKEIHSTGQKNLSQIFQTFENIVVGLTSVSHVYLESVMFDDKPNEKFPLSCIENIFQAKYEMQVNHERLGYNLIKFTRK